MSFAGSLARINKMHPAVKWTLGYWILLPVWWAMIVLWYVVFGLLVVPWRLIRRGQRRDKYMKRSMEEIKREVGRDER